MGDGMNRHWEQAKEDAEKETAQWEKATEETGQTLVGKKPKPRE